MDTSIAPASRLGQSPKIQLVFPSWSCSSRICCIRVLQRRQFNLIAYLHLTSRLTTLLSLYHQLSRETETRFAKPSFRRCTALMRAAAHFRCNTRTCEKLCFSQGLPPQATDTEVSVPLRVLYHSRTLKSFAFGHTGRWAFAQQKGALRCNDCGLERYFKTPAPQAADAAHLRYRSHYTTFTDDLR